MNKEKLIGLKTSEVKELLDKRGIEYLDEVEKKLTFKETSGYIVDIKEDEEGRLVLYESNRKMLVFIIILIALIVGLASTLGNGIYESIKEQIIEITGVIGKPELEAGNEWSKEGLVRVVKDAKSSKQISFYEYCVREDTKEECNWKETHTKNALIGETGHWYVTFRAVDIEGRRGQEATKEVYVDNNAPEINSFKVIEKKETSIKVKVEAKDAHSGIEKIMYSLDGVAYSEGKEEYTFNNLLAGTVYRVYVKVIDKVGNESVVSIEVETELSEEQKQEGLIPKEEKEWDIPKIHLNEVPSVFKYGEKYDLPSFYDFGNDEGSVVCLVDEKEVKDTSLITVGKHTIICTATSKHGKIAKVEKEIEVEVLEGADEIFDGWLRLNLYYPEGSTDWEWRLDGENGIRTGYNGDNWQAYTGPILIKLEDIENVYIRYKLNGETVIIAPRGKVVIDIEPEKWTLKDGETTKVKISFDSNAKTKKYRINGGSWQEYAGEFEVGANTLIEAKATKDEKVYDSEGEYQYTKTITGVDTAYISIYVKPGESAPSGPGGIPMGPIGGNPSNPGSPSGPSGSGIPWGPIAGTPSPSVLAGPIISSNPNSVVVEETEITITPQQEAYKIYYKINNGVYQEYTNPFTVKENSTIYAYYVSKAEGQTSQTSYYRVSNIKERNLPYVRIDANPDYIGTSVSSTQVTITGSDYDTLEYSLDGVIYQTYTSPLTITESKTVYARGTNAYGSKIEHLTITTKQAPSVTEKEELTVLIEADPAGSEGLLAYTDVSITYDTRATNKYYSIDGGKTYQSYTGPFRVNKNTTVVGYATSANGSGQDELMIDYLSNGISSPVIKSNPTSPTQAYKVTVEIKYDKNANAKKYKIGNGGYQDYTAPFEVDNNTTITAYNSNALGQDATSTLTITNVVPAPRYTQIDLGDYYLFKLNYPDVSNEESREYKWKDSGVWKTYDSYGILIIKQEAANKYDLTADGVEITDTNGNKVKINMEHVYVLDCPASEIAGNIYMRWDVVQPKAPVININPSDATKEVEVSITYAKQLVEKYYKVVNEDGTDSGWKEYKGPFKVAKNNTIIYAKGTDRSEVKSDITNKKITNIDEVAPTIDIKGDFITPKRSVPIQITGKDNLQMYMVKYAQGKHNADYFNEEKEDNGKSIKNGSTITLTENGIYTIYAVDSVGNETVREIEIENIDLEAPDIAISVLTSGITTSAEVSIDYGDSSVKQYSIGDNTHYVNYPASGNLTISSYDYYNKANEDGTLTIYAKGQDSAGNIEEVSEKIYCLDLDMPSSPVISASIDYPSLTEYGVNYKDNLTVSYDKRNDIVNEISLDGGTTWKVYTGLEHVSSGTVKARSRKTSTGLTTPTVTKNVVLPSGILGPSAYDNNNTTSVSIGAGNAKRLNVSSEMQGQKMYVFIHTGSFQNNQIIMYNESNQAIKTYTLSTENYSNSNQDIKKEYLIDEGTAYIVFQDNLGYRDASHIYEIKQYNNPTISSVKNHPILTESGITPSYDNVSISYFQTAVTKQYRIGDGSWLNYTGTLKLSAGQTIYARSIDKNGTVSEVSSYTTAIPSNGLGPNAYDNNNTTSVSIGAGNAKRLNVSSEMQGQKMYVFIHTGSFQNNQIIMYNESNQAIKTYTLSTENYSNSNQDIKKEYLIDEGTAYIVFQDNLGYRDASHIYEIKQYNNPTISSVKNYPILTESGITPSYDNVSISYFQTAVTKQYRIGDGSWLNYTGTLKLSADQTIYARSIDKNGTVSEVSSYTTAIPSNGLGPSAYDNNNATSVSIGAGNAKRLNVSSEMQGQKMYVFIHTAYFQNNQIVMYNESNQKIKTYTLSTEDYSNSNKDIKKEYLIESGTTYIIFQDNLGHRGASSVYEISPVAVQNLTSSKLRQVENTLSANTITDSISKKANTPVVQVTTNENSKTVTINVDTEYRKEYSLDLGNTWLEYTEPFEVSENTVVFTRVVDNDNKVLSSSTYTISTIVEKEKEEEPIEESTEVLPSEETPEVVEEETIEEEKPEGSDVDE